MRLSFAPVGDSQQACYQAYLDACPQVASDYSFVNLWSWAEVYGLEWAFSDNLVWIRQNRPEPVLWAPVGDWRQMDWKTLKEELYPDFKYFIRVPVVLANIWSTVFGEQMEANTDRDQWDYLYDARDLRELRGNRFHKKKNLVNQFKKKIGIFMWRWTRKWRIGPWRFRTTGAHGGFATRLLNWKLRIRPL